MDNNITNMEILSTEEQTNDDTEIQEIRTFLREKFLRFIANISNGPKCEINMCENIQVNGNLRAFDLEFENIAVHNLQTPSLPVEKAILRTNDIISIHLKDVSIESLIN